LTGPPYQPLNPAMAARTVRAILLCLLAASTGLSAAGTTAPGSPSVEQKFGWGDLDALRAQVEQGVNKATNDLSNVVASYKDTAKEYAEALKDKAFMKAAQATGICEKLLPAEEKSAPEIEEEMPEVLADSKSTSPENVECEAVATEVSGEEVKQQLEGGMTGDAAQKMVGLITSRSSAALCEGKNGIIGWIKENKALKDADPSKYKEQLQKQLNDEVGPTLKRFTKNICSPNELRRFSADTLVNLEPMASGRTSTVLLMAFALAFAGLGALAARRATRQAGALDLEPSAPEVLLEGGAQE